MSLEGLDIPFVGMAVLASAALAERGVRGAVQFLADQRERKALQVADVARTTQQNRQRQEADARLILWQKKNGVPVEGNGLRDVA